MRYSFPLNRMFETVPGSVSLTVRGTRALESSGIQVISFANVLDQQPGFNINEDLGDNFCTQRGGTLTLNEPVEGQRGGNCRVPVDMVGQIRSNTFVPGVAASPTWSGNFVATYMLRSLTASLSARYIGAAKLDNLWCDADQFARDICTNYVNAEGQYLNGSVDRNWVEPYMNFSLNGSYDLQVGNLKQFQVFGSINNLFDKSPPFTGGGISGASAGYHDTMGRAYRMGVRMKF
jgi:hypothetical protein